MISVIRVSHNSSRVKNRGSKIYFEPITYYVCLCDCGNEIIRQHYDIINPRIKSCGCYTSNRMRKLNVKHRLSKTPEFKAWQSMKERCYNPRYAFYKNYGGRGIKVSNEFMHDFETFYKCVGNRPSPKHSLDRINVDGDYTRGNLRWATAKEQVRNRRNTKLYTYGCVTGTVAEWEEILNIKQASIRHLIYSGKTIKDIAEKKYPELIAA